MLITARNGRANMHLQLGYKKQTKTVSCNRYTLALVKHRQEAQPVSTRSNSPTAAVAIPLVPSLVCLSASPQSSIERTRGLTIVFLVVGAVALCNVRVSLPFFLLFRRI